MNTMFFSGSKTQEETSENVDVSFVNLSNQFSAATSRLSGDMVLVLSKDVAGVSTSAPATKPPTENPKIRLQPYHSNKAYDGVVKKSNVPTDFGFIPEQNQTLSMQQNATRQAKFVYFNYLKLITKLNNLLSLTQNQLVRQELVGVRQEAIISSTILSNIIGVISFNQNPVLNDFNTESRAGNFAAELRGAIRTVDTIISGLTRLNRMIFIPQINWQLQILQLSAVNMRNSLTNLR